MSKVKKKRLKIGEKRGKEGLRWEGEERLSAGGEGVESGKRGREGQ